MLVADAAGRRQTSRMTYAMPPVAQHVDAVEVAAGRLVAWAAQAGLDAPVPTCPGWSVLDLVAHQGMVHRWATAIVRGVDPRTVDEAAFEAEGRVHEDPGAWLAAGASELVAALRSAPDDLDVMTFLREAPPARAFWARRQCHETTVHALDSLAAASDGRTLTAADVWLDESLSVDGVDELLVGFWQRRSKGPRTEQPYTASISIPSGPTWVLDVRQEHPVTRRLGEGDGIPHDARPLSGTAADLYLALWNRGGAVDDPTDLLTEWRDPGAITW